jgi:sulfatase modifying factor 1
MLPKILATLCLCGVLAAETARAVTVDMVTVGNPGNAPDTRYNGTSIGSVDHVYRIGKYEITAGQYAEFLNAVAKDDPNDLYAPSMAFPGGEQYAGPWGCNIRRNGASPTYSYSIAADWADRPVNWVSFWDAARFANWLHNGQPTGPEGPGTTEDGAYHDVGNQSLFARNPGAKFFIPTVDEWYKAAYHDKSAGLAAKYFDYPTGSNNEPFNTLPDPGNHANFYDYRSNASFDYTYTIGSPYYRTPVGAFVNSASSYGTFDQGGNVSERNETILGPTTRGERGGSFQDHGVQMQAAFYGYGYPIDTTFKNYDLGFRVAAAVPEPSAGMLAILAIGIMWLWKNRFVA